jgi:hypothetical protein
VPPPPPPPQAESTNTQQEQEDHATSFVMTMVKRLDPDGRCRL